MRAALLRELGGTPVPADVEEPQAEAGQALVEVSAAGLNPVDIAIGAGRFYGGKPPLPLIPGSEAVGRDAETGRRVYVSGDGLGARRHGTLAERATVAREVPIPLPDGVDDGQAIAAGVAGLAGWLPLSWRAPVRSSDRVLVLGATGCAGRIATQAARLLGAERLVAAGRNADRLALATELGADETVDVGRDDLVAAFRDASGGDGPTLVVDLLWNGPVAAAAEAAARGARIVQVGQSAGPEATLRSNDVRGKQLELLGYSNFAAPRDVLRTGYLELIDHIAAERIRVNTESYPLERIAEAWQRQAAGPGTKLIVRP
jgi:NADPH2:quinone reductase